VSFVKNRRGVVSFAALISKRKKERKSREKGVD
jgi:hypothetical protein